MSLFKKIKTALTPKLYAYDPEHLHPKARNFLELCNSAQYQDASDLFYAEPRNERTYLLEAVNAMVEQDDFYDAWFNNSNGPPLSCLLRGSLLTQRAWHYRGYGRGEEVSDANVDLMHQCLNKAYNSLVPILRGEHLGQDSCAKIIRVLMGLNAEWEQIDEALAILRSFGGPHLLGEMNYLIASCEKWLGSHDKMYQSAHDACELYPNNPDITALYATAHWERQLHYDVFEKNETDAEAFRNNPDILTDMTYRSKHLLKLGVGREGQFVIAHNLYAAFFCERGEWDLAQPHFAKMKTRISVYPWEFYEDDFLHRAYNISML
ncbi:MAG: hypothetical protein ABJG88_08750 [Litorimonas sp.]